MRTLAMLCWAVLLVPSAFADDWPLVRGNPLQTGVATAPLPTQLEVLWKVKTGDSIEAGAAIVGDVVYVGSLDEHLYALKLSDGQQLWKVKTGAIKAAPSHYKDAIYVGTEEGNFVCLDAKTGAKRWLFETGGEITASANFAGDKVVIGSYDATLYCLNTEGKLQWKFKTQGPINGSAAIVGKHTFVAGCDSDLHVVDLDTGKAVTKVNLGGQAAATAALQGDLLYIGTMTNQVLGVNWKKSEIVWTYENEQRSQPFFASAAVTDKLVIASGRDKLVHALARDTGKEVWSYATKSRLDGSPVIAGASVYAPSLDGSLYVLSLAKGELQQKLDLGRALPGSPAIAGGRLVIGNSEGVIYCLGAKQ